MAAPRRGMKPQKTAKGYLSLQSTNWDQFGLFGLRSGSYKSHLFNQKTLALGVRFPEVNYTNQDGSIIEPVSHGEYVKAGREDRKRARMDRANAKARQARLIKNKASRTDFLESASSEEFAEMSSDDAVKHIKHHSHDYDHVAVSKEAAIKAAVELTEAQHPLMSSTEVFLCKIERASVGAASPKTKKR